MSKKTVASPRERIRGFFAKRPNALFERHEVFHGLPDIAPALITYHLRRLVNDETLKKPERNRYGYNNAERKTIDIVRTEALRLGKERVVQDPSISFSPTQPAITIVENPTAALNAKRRHYRSLISRMERSAEFSAADIELLDEEAPQLATPLPALAPSAALSLNGKH